VLDEEFQLLSEQHRRTEELYKTGMISQIEYEKSRASILQKEYSIKGAKMGITSAGIRLADLEQLVITARRDNITMEWQLRNGVRQAYDNLLGRIQRWELEHVLKAPMNGTVSLIGFWNDGQNVVAGDNVLVIVPDETGILIGRIRLPARGSGKVRVGQSVNVKIANYPHAEFGVVKGIVLTKSLVPEEDCTSSNNPDKCN
jgi:multidrug resistance efflux pump